MQRHVIRLGEHDLLTSEDGPHLDVDVGRAEMHEKYDEDLDVNDIAMIYLEDDVEFTGWSSSIPNTVHNTTCVPFQLTFFCFN